MRILYFDCFAGASGDMILGALLDLGIDVGIFKRELAKKSNKLNSNVIIIPDTIMIVSAIWRILRK